MSAIQVSHFRIWIHTYGTTFLKFHQFAIQSWHFLIHRLWKDYCPSQDLNWDREKEIKREKEREIEMESEREWEKEIDR